MKIIEHNFSIDFESFRWTDIAHFIEENKLHQTNSFFAEFYNYMEEEGMIELKPFNEKEIDAMSYITTIFSKMEQCRENVKKDFQHYFKVSQIDYLQDFPF